LIAMLLNRASTKKIPMITSCIISIVKSELLVNATVLISSPKRANMVIMVTQIW
jgi:hypothetical protein